MNATQWTSQRMCRFYFVSCFRANLIVILDVNSKINIKNWWPRFRPKMVTRKFPATSNKFQFTKQKYIGIYFQRSDLQVTAWSFSFVFKDVFNSKCCFLVFKLDKDMEKIGDVLFVKIAQFQMKFFHKNQIRQMKFALFYKTCPSFRAKAIQFTCSGYDTG